MTKMTKTFSFKLTDVDKINMDIIYNISAVLLSGGKIEITSVEKSKSKHIIDFDYKTFVLKLSHIFVYF